MSKVIIRKTYIIQTCTDDQIVLEPGIKPGCVGIVITRPGETRRTWIDIATWIALCNMEYTIRRETPILEEEETDDRSKERDL